MRAQTPEANQSDVTRARRFAPQAEPLAALSEVLLALHAEPRSPDLEHLVAGQLERLIAGGAAAVFSAVAGEEGVVTRRAAGPRWRTAEREVPTRLALERLGLSDLVRSGLPVDGTLAVPGPLPDAEGDIELIHRPVRVRGESWGALVVLLPRAGGAPEDRCLVEACATHLGLALARLGRLPEGTDLRRVRDDLQHYLRTILALLEPCLLLVPPGAGPRAAVEAAVVAALEAAAYTDGLGVPPATRAQEGGLAVD